MLKLALNKSTCASDNEQGINKLWPCIPNFFSATYPESKFVLFQEDIHDVISTVSLLPP